MITFVYCHVLAMNSNKCDKSQIMAQLKRVTEDDIFASAPRYVELLNYLVEMACQGTSLKEFSIGEALFKGSYNIDKGSAIVRVHMYNLRKKLSEYYTQQGASDPIIFYIPKRSYDLKYRLNEASAATHSPKKFELNLRIDLRWCVTIVVAILLLSLLVAKGHLNTTEYYCWSHFMSRDAVNTCIMANHTSVTMRLDSTDAFVVHRDILTEEDYNRLVKREVINPQEVRVNRYKFFTKAIPLSIQSLSRWFYEGGVSYDIIEESEFKFDLTRRSNIIYIGQYKTMSVSKEVFLRNSKLFELNGRYIYRREQDRLNRLNSIHTDNHIQEYAMVSYTPLENGHKALYFVSNNDIGTMATINQFMSHSFLAEFYKQLPSKDSYFNALFKVEGVDRINVTSELVELEVIQ